jgi:hypothetical protein
MKLVPPSLPWSSRCVLYGQYSLRSVKLLVYSVIQNSQRIRSVNKWRVVYDYTGRFIMFPVITNIYNKKTKGPTSMELSTTTRKLKKFFCDNWRCSMCAQRVTRHTSIRYSSSCHTHTRQHGCIDILHYCNYPCL